MTMSSKTLRIGFVGLGIMGVPMVENLFAAGYPLCVYNRTKSKAEALVRDGVCLAKSLAEVTERSDIIITNVTDTNDVEEVLFAEGGLAVPNLSDKVFIDMSTIRSDKTEEFAKKLKGLGYDFLDAPVSGGDVGAKAGTLTIMVGGEEEVFEKVLPVLEVLGKSITLVGGHGAGQVVKACNQVLVALHMVAVCETLTLAKHSNVDLNTLLDVVTGGAAQSWALEKLGRAIVKEDLSPGFMIKLILKDLSIVQDSAKRLGLALPGLGLAESMFRSASNLGAENLGTQAMIKVYDQLNPMKS